VPNLCRRRRAVEFYNAARPSDLRPPLQVWLEAMNIAAELAVTTGGDKVLVAVEFERVA
jgi:hypothetical protein